MKRHETVVLRKGIRTAGIGEVSRRSDAQPMTEENEITLGTALGMLFDAMLESTGHYGVVMRMPSPTGETWIGWRKDRTADTVEAPIKLPMFPSQVNKAIASIVAQARAAK